MTITTTTSSTLSNIPTAQLGGKKKNGNKSKYSFQNYVNMRHSKKKGGADEEDQQGDIEEGFTPTDNTSDEEVESTITAAINDQEAEASSEDYDLNSAELGEAGPSIKAGGSRRRKKMSSRKTKKSRKSRKTKKSRKSSKRRSHKRH